MRHFQETEGEGGVRLSGTLFALIHRAVYEQDGSVVEVGFFLRCATKALERLAYSWHSVSCCGGKCAGGRSSPAGVGCRETLSAERHLAPNALAALRIP